MVKRIVLLSVVLCTSLAVAQYPHTLTPKSFDITSTCSAGTSCWNDAGAVIAPLSGSIGKDGYNLWVKSDGTLQHYNFTSKTMEAVTMADHNMKQVAVVDRNTIYRLAASDSLCGTGPTWRPQKWSWASQTWVPLMTTVDCQYAISAGTDGTLMAVGYNGNANGHVIYKWNGSSWAQFGTTNLLTLSVADSTHACGMSKISGTAKIYTQSGSNFAVMSVQPPGTLMGCTMGKGSTDADYTLVAWNNVSAAYIYDYATTTWKSMPGLLISSNSMAIVARSKGLVWAIGTDGKVHHWNVMAQGYTANISGIWSKCPQISCPPTGVTHAGTVQVTIPNGMSGPVVHSSVVPTGHLDISSSDYSPNCDNFAGQPTNACLTDITETVICSQSGTNLAGNPDVGCVMTGEDAGGMWDFGSTVTVYFDSIFFPATTCPPGLQNTTCNVWQGILNWDAQTDRIIHYRFGGVVNVGTCTITTMDGNIYVPCNPTYPFMMVTGMPDMGGYSGPIFKPSGGNGQFGYIFLGTDVLDGPMGEQKTSAAHEEGHHHGLANCDPLGQNGTPTCNNTMTPADTVMWWQYDPSQPWSPTACDREWANFFESFL